MRWSVLIVILGLGGCSRPEPPPVGSGGGGDDASVRSDGGSDADLAQPPADSAVPATQQGKLVGGPGAYPGAIAGVPFSSGGTSGVTDAQGTFSYETGKPITFTVANATTVPVMGRALLSPFQLAGSPQCQLTQPVKDLVGVLYAPDPAPVHAFIRQVDGELWSETSMETFSATDSAQRSQGITTDGTKWIFSWRLGLETADTTFHELGANQLAIPLLFSAQGSDHIGDIDYYNGKIYAPVEDSKNYAHPTLLLYDANSLSYTNVSYALPQPLQTKGVPWVAVDGPRGKVITAEWDPTPQLNLFDLSTLAVAGSVPLSTTLGRIQGAKVFEAMLYANADDAQKTTYKINLESGTVITLFSSGRTDVEAEGLALWAQNGALLHTLNTNGGKTAMELHHHQRTRDPLRRSICP